MHGTMLRPNRPRRRFGSGRQSLAMALLLVLMAPLSISAWAVADEPAAHIVSLTVDGLTSGARYLPIPGYDNSIVLYECQMPCAAQLPVNEWTLHTATIQTPDGEPVVGETLTADLCYGDCNRMVRLLGERTNESGVAQFLIPPPATGETDVQVLMHSPATGVQRYNLLVGGEIPRDPRELRFRPSDGWIDFSFELTERDRVYVEFWTDFGPTQSSSSGEPVRFRAALIDLESRVNDGITQSWFSLHMREGSTTTVMANASGQGIWHEREADALSSPTRRDIYRTFQRELDAGDFWLRTRLGRIGDDVEPTAGVRIFTIRPDSYALTIHGNGTFEAAPPTLTSEGALISPNGFGPYIGTITATSQAPERGLSLALVRPPFFGVGTATVQHDDSQISRYIVPGETLAVARQDCPGTWTASFRTGFGASQPLVFLAQAEGLQLTTFARQMLKAEGSCDL